MKSVANVSSLGVRRPLGARGTCSNSQGFDKESRLQQQPLRRSTYLGYRRQPNGRRDNETGRPKVYHVVATSHDAVRSRSDALGTFDHLGNQYTAGGLQMDANGHLEKCVEHCRSEGDMGNWREERDDKIKLTVA